MPLKPNRMRWNDALSRVDATRFEALIADHYRAEGWAVDYVGAAATGSGTDGGIDLKLRRGDAYVVVQCKRWEALQVTHNPVHELIGVMITQRATGAVVVTSGEFTRAAIEAARQEPRIQLVDGATVREWIDVAALEAEAGQPPPPAIAATGDWTQVFAHRETDRRTASRSRKGTGAPLIALAAAVALAAFLAFLFLPLRPATPNATARPPAPTREAPLAPTSYPTSPTTAPATPTRTPERAGRLRAIAEPMERATTAYLREAGLPDTRRPIDHEAARMAAKTVPGVRSALWLDHDNFVVMVDGADRRSMAMIDDVCLALEPLGDTLAVIVNVQDITAQHADGATTLSRNCQLAEGQRAFFQRKRQVDVVAPEVRALFKGQQAKK
ncbi:restriction endonuclease [Dokdonella fugitiva]|uniref:restriction endonuclease n=1 Tax=Dokdonella fugitiva TaxID=328517 RepID=UPI0015FD8F1D|nr:restriction endonuclease [Dokdonella fugitiva]MBA8884420.1 hypothetical protein [Dokdonella fugitiva]